MWGDSEARLPLLRRAEASRFRFRAWPPKVGRMNAGCVGVVGRRSHQPAASWEATSLNWRRSWEIVGSDSLDSKVTSAVAIVLGNSDAESFGLEVGGGPRGPGEVWKTLAGCR